MASPDVKETDMGAPKAIIRNDMAAPEAIIENGIVAAPEATIENGIVAARVEVKDNSTADPEAKGEMCIMCLEAPAVTKVAICQHSFCEGCLTSHQQEGKGDETLLCPACESQPEDERKANEAGAGDSGEDKKNTTIGDGLGMTIPKPVAADQVRLKGPFVEGNCKLCYYQGRAVKAVKACEECQRLPLCANCTDVHRANKATKDHVIATLKNLKKRKDAVCDEHKERLDTFCSTCSKYLCHVCLSIGHADHAIEPLSEVIHVKVGEMRSALEYEETVRFSQLRRDDKMLAKSKETVQEMEDALIKGLEDHAEKCIDEILKNKDELKKQLRSDFEVKDALTKRVEAMPELLRVSEEKRTGAKHLLGDGAELQPTYVDKLKALLKELDHLKVEHPGYWLDKKAYQEAFESLCQKAPKFFPREPNLNIGGFEEPAPTCKDGGACVCEICKQAIKKP